MRPRPALPYPSVAFHTLLDRTAERCAEELAVCAEGERYSYRELHALTFAAAGRLTELGVRAGDRVAVVAGNSVEWLVLVYGLSRLGAAAALLSPSWRAAELAHAVGVVQPRLVIADADVVAELRAAAVPERQIVVLDDSGGLSANALARRPGAVLDLAPVDLDSEVILPFSSGTTGLPKAVRHTHRTLVAGVTNWASAARINADDHLQVAIPLFHIYGLVVTACALAAGARVSLFRRFVLDDALEHIGRTQVTIAFGAAPIAVAMANHPSLESFDLRSLRYFQWAATPIVPTIAEAVSARTGIAWMHAYGATEAPGLFCNPVEDPDLWRLDSPGIALSDTEVRIDTSVAPANAEAPVGVEVGELLVRGPHLMVGYLPEEANAGAFTDDGWYRTGDIGWLDPEGWLHLTDRAKELIKVSGFSVSPAEVERALLAHPDVRDCAVYGVPDGKGSDEVAAAIVSDSADLVAVQAWVNERVAPYKRLRYVRPVDDIPRTASGKVLRRQLLDDHHHQI